MRIAMWSGPRNLSTAMMYAFAARSDCTVVDEPFYASYLAATGLQHPMRNEILASQPQDPETVIRKITGSIPGNKRHFYQKHMTQHMVSGINRDWMSEFTNVFLIRHPARVAASFAAKHEDPTLDDLGIVQQVELYDHVLAQGGKPIVIDSADIREFPQQALQRLCREIGLDWSLDMLRWPAGGNPADGIWARHWYGAVHKSIGFAGAEGPLPQLDAAGEALVLQAMPYYTKMKLEEH